MFEITKTTNITNTKLALEHRYCDDGDSGDGYTCRCVPGSVGTDVANGAATCVENTCDAFEFTEGMIGDGSDACSDNIILTAVDDHSCNLACDDAYKSSGSAEVTCSLDGGAAESDFTCTEMTCDDADCGDNASCDDYLRLGYVCTCDEGYSGDDVYNGAATCTNSPCGSNPPVAYAVFSETCVGTDGSNGECTFTCSAGYEHETYIATCNLGT